MSHNHYTGGAGPAATSKPPKPFMAEFSCPECQTDFVTALTPGTQLIFNSCHNCGAMIRLNIQVAESGQYTWTGTVETVCDE